MANKKSVDISRSNVKVKVSSAKKSPVKKIVSWIVIILLFYVLTSAQTSTETVQVEKAVSGGNPVPVVVEKSVNVTKYREEKVPFGEPRCELLAYNFTKDYTYSEVAINGQRTGICTYDIKNEEDIAGTFRMYVNILKSGKISDSPDYAQVIPPFGTVKFQWNFTLGLGDSASCLLQCTDCPKREKCFYLEPTTYQIKQVPYNVEEKKNVTEYTTSGTSKQNVVKNVYTNKFFGYRQFFYFGY